MKWVIIAARATISFHAFISSRLGRRSTGGLWSNHFATTHRLLVITSGTHKGVNFKPVVVTLAVPYMDNVLLQFEAEQVLRLVTRGEVVLVLEQLVLLIESLNL
jgi:hypothetical protein